MGLTGRHMTRIELLRPLKVDVHETRLAGVEGYVETIDGKYLATISTDAAETRRRFTLAHVVSCGSHEKG
jgi:hypothetical protein